MDLKAMTQEGSDSREHEEFTITSAQLEDSNDLDEDQIFVPLDDENDIIEKNNDANLTEVVATTSLVTETIERKKDPKKNDNGIIAINKIIRKSSGTVKRQLMVFNQQKVKMQKPLGKVEQLEETKPSGSGSTDSNVTSSSNTPGRTHLRSEDEIFGELVTAVLSRMEETKKKSAKKEIMNVLLS